MIRKGETTRSCNRNQIKSPVALLSCMPHGLLVIRLAFTTVRNRMRCCTICACEAPKLWNKVTIIIIIIYYIMTIIIIIVTNDDKNESKIRHSLNPVVVYYFVRTPHDIFAKALDLRARKSRFSLGESKTRCRHCEKSRG